MNQPWGQQKLHSPITIHYWEAISLEPALRTAKVTLPDNNTLLGDNLS